MKRKKYLKLLIPVAGILLIIACEGSRYAGGTVYDSINNLPLDSVLCISNGGYQLLTDSTGGFELSGPFGGCMPKCPKVEVEFSKEGYISQKKTDDFESIYLEKE